MFNGAPTKKWLIVNADDYGYFDCVSRGILRAATHGVVTATGLFATSPLFDEHVVWLRDCESLDLGIHLNLTDGLPLTERMRGKLARSGGRFPGKFGIVRAILSGAVGRRDVAEEWRSQIDRGVAAGLQIRFVNSHEHIHMLPGLFPVAQELAREFGIAHVRFPTPEMPRKWGASALLRDSAMTILARYNRRHAATPVAHFLGMGDSGRLSLGYLDQTIPALADDRVYELMCHPGYLDHAEVTDARLLGYHDWRGELATLTDPAVPELFRRHGVRLIGYRDLEIVGGRLIAGCTAA